MGWTKLDKQELARLGRAYQVSGSIAEVAKAFGVSVGTCRSYLVSLGLLDVNGEREPDPPLYRCSKCLGRSTAPVHTSCAWRRRA